MGQNLTFQSTIYKPEGNNGLGEWRAQFVTGNQDLAGAFSNAAGRQALRTMGGVVQLNQAQLAERIQQLSGKEGFETALTELGKGQHAIEARLAAPKTAPAARPAQGITA